MDGIHALLVVVGGAILLEALAMIMGYDGTFYGATMAFLGVAIKCLADVVLKRRKR